MLSLPACLRLVCASPPTYDNGYEGMPMDQDVLGKMCPDYTSYARLKQYVTVRPPVTNADGSLANHTAKAHCICRTSDLTLTAESSPRRLSRRS